MPAITAGDDTAGDNTRGGGAVDGSTTDAPTGDGAANPVSDASATDAADATDGETSSSLPALTLPPPAAGNDDADEDRSADDDTTSASTNAEPSTTPTTATNSTSPGSSSTASTPEEEPGAPTTTAGPTTTGGAGGVVGERPDGAGNPAGICLDGVIQPMADDASCGYADIGGYCLEQINHWRAQEGLEPFVRLEEFEACAAREARLALEAGKAHFSDNCGWRAQASSGGGRGGEGSNGTIEKSVWWLPKLIFDEGPDGGHYQGMMTERVRGVACGYFASDRDAHRIIINYYDL